MERDMSSHLDASFATRGAGQLVNEQVVSTRERRAGNMQRVTHGLSRDGRYTVRPTRNLAGSEMLPGMGMGGVNIPGFGEVSWSTIGITVAGIGAAWWLFKRR